MMFERFCRSGSSGVDLYLTYNAPRRSVRERGGGVPYVVLAGDVEGMRSGIPTDAEREMYQNAHAIITGCLPVALWLHEHYGVTAELVPVLPLERDLDFEPHETIPKTCVYAGGLIPWESKDKLFGYKALHDVFKAVINAGWEMHGYCLNHSVRKEYEDMGVIWHDPVHPGALYKELSRYAVGLQAFSRTGTKESRAYARIAVPNKAYDYIGAGIPVLGYNTSVDYTGSGANIKSLRQMKAGLESASRVKPRPPKVIDDYAHVFERIVSTVPARPDTRRYTLGIPKTVRLGDCSFAPGDTVTHAQAVALRDAGLIAGKGMEG